MASVYFPGPAIFQCFHQPSVGSLGQLLIFTPKEYLALFGCTALSFAFII